MTVNSACGISKCPTVAAGVFARDVEIDAVNEASRPTIQSIAQLAGVSTATVDRVLNNRGGVSEKTVSRVAAAAEELNRNGPASDAVYDVILPRDSGFSTKYLGAAFQYHAAKRGVRLRHTLVERLHPQSLAAELYRCEREGSHGVAFQALEDPIVREAAASLSNRKIPIATVCSDLPGMGFGYVGLDNRAAGRAAGYMMGLLCGGKGPVAIIWGGNLYRSHEEREAGARSFLRAEYPNIEIVDIEYNHNDLEANKRFLSLLTKERTFSGIYCVGGEIIDAVKALDSRRQSAPIVVVGHNLTENTTNFLMRRQVDAIIHQDMLAIAGKSLDFMLAGYGRIRVPSAEIPIEIITRENLSHHLELDQIRPFVEYDSDVRAAV